MASSSQSFLLPFLKKEQIAKDIYSFFFDRTKGGFSAKGGPATSWDFLPGQYIRLVLPHKNPDDRGTSRFFTIASSPLEKDILMITTRIIQSTFKKTLFALKPGENGQFFGPIGTFFLDEKDLQERVFLAGGIGITPFHSMITFAAAKDLKLPITLLVSFSTIEEMVFYQELIEIGEKHQNIHVIYTITKPQESNQEWTGETGRISKEMLRKYINDLQKPLYYIAGPPIMVEGIRQLVSEIGVDEEKVISKDFTGY